MRHRVAQVCGLIGVLFVASAAWSKVSVTQADSTTVYDIEIDGVTFDKIAVEGSTYTQASLHGVDGYAAVTHEIGAPELPVLRFYADGDIQVSLDRNLVDAPQKMPTALKPTQPSWSKSQKTRPALPKTLSKYQSQMVWGASPYTVEETASVRGRVQKLVTLYPFVYNADTGSYSLRKRFTVRVIRGYQASVKSQTTPTIAFVIGSQFALSEKIDQLENNKREHGFNVTRVVVGQNGVNTDFDVRSALKRLLKDESVNLRYAILIGDIADVPSHTSGIIQGVTDHYYRAIDTDSYEDDINGPDIGVGRLSVSNSAELAVVIDKILKYSAADFDRSDWLNHPLFVTTHDRWTVAEGTHNAVIKTHFEPLNYDRVFPDANEKGGDKLYPITYKATPAQIVSHMAAGRSIINFSGHGSYTGWEDVTMADIKKLQDPDALPYVISNACITGNFRIGSVFAEEWLRAPHGAITFWGSMDSTYWDEDDILEKELYAGLFTRGIRAFDLLHQNALLGLWKAYGGKGRSKYYWETYVTFGDPSLDFRIGPPSASL